MSYNKIVDIFIIFGPIWGRQSPSSQCNQSGPAYVYKYTIWSFCQFSNELLQNSELYRASNPSELKQKWTILEFSYDRIIFVTYK